MVSSSSSARSAYPFHILPTTFMVSRAGGAAGWRVQAQPICAPVPWGVTDQAPSMLLTNGRQLAVQVVEDVGEAVRPVDRGERLAQAAAIGEHDRAGLADGAPLVRLVDHLADRGEGGVAPREDLRQPSDDQSIEGPGRLDSDEPGRIDAVPGHGHRLRRREADASLLPLDASQ